MDEERIKKLKRSLTILKVGNTRTSISGSGVPQVFVKTDEAVTEFLEDLTNVVSELAEEMREAKYK